MPLAKIGAPDSRKRRKKPPKTFSKLTLDKQQKSAKLDLTRTSDFNFEEFKQSFARLNMVLGQSC